MNQLRSEIRKAVATKSWIWLTLGAVIMVLLWTVATFFLMKFVASVGSADTAGLGLGTTAGVQEVYSVVGNDYSWLFALILGAVAGTSEFRFGTIVTTFLTTPHRERPILAKMAATGIIGGLMGLIVVTVGYLTATILLLTVDHAPVSYSKLGLIVLGALLAYVLVAIVGVSIGTLLRNQILAVVLVIVWVLLIQRLLAVAFTLVWHLDYIAKFFPAQAIGSVVGAASPSVAQLPAWAGALTLIGYAAVFAGIAFTTSLRRDVG
jgi:ABC-2 type transport system permease protein